MDTDTVDPIREDLERDLKQRFPDASDHDIASAVSMGIQSAKSQAEFSHLAVSSAAGATGGASSLGLDTSQLFRNYGDCASKAKAVRDAAIAASNAMSNPLFKMGAVAAANAAYAYAQGVCHRMYPT